MLVNLCETPIHAIKSFCSCDLYSKPPSVTSVFGTPKMEKSRYRAFATDNVLLSGILYTRTNLLNASVTVHTYAGLPCLSFNGPYRSEWYRYPMVGGNAIGLSGGVGKRYLSEARQQVSQSAT